MRVRSVLSWMAAAVLALGMPGAVYAGNLVTNGDFTQYTGGIGQLKPGTGATTELTGWTVDPSVGTGGNPGNWLFDGNNIAAGSAMQGGPVFLWGPPSPPPVAGNILAMDGDSLFRGSIWQEITGLVTGQTYDLTFYRSSGQLTSFSGPTETQFQVSFGGATQSTSLIQNASESWSGSWIKESMTFTATGTSQILTFLAIGTPDNVPPIALLSGIELQAVPEPSTLVGLGIGLVGMGLVRRFRKRSA